MSSLRSDSGGGVQLPFAPPSNSGSTAMNSHQHSGGNARGSYAVKGGGGGHVGGSVLGSDLGEDNKGFASATRVESCDPLLRTDYETFLYDSFSLQVSLSVIVQQLILHLTFPLCLPYFIHRYGWLFLYTQNFISKWTIGALMFSEWFFSASLIITTIAYKMSPEDLGFEIAFPVCLYIMHRTMVALKYGTLSPTEYRKMMRGSVHKDCKSGFFAPLPSEKEINQVRRFQSQLQLISGWVRLGEGVPEHELLTAAARLGLNLRDYHFVIPSPDAGENESMQFARWKYLLAIDSPIVNGEIRGLHRQPDGTYRVRTDRLCVALVKSTANSELITAVRYGILVLAIINAGIPLWCSTNYSWSKWRFVFFTVSFYLNLMLSLAILSFVQAAFMDFYRRMQFANALQSLIRPSDINACVNVRIKTKDTDMTKGIRRMTMPKAPTSLRSSVLGSSSALNRDGGSPIAGLSGSSGGLHKSPSEMSLVDEDDDIGFIDIDGVRVMDAIDEDNEIISLASVDGSQVYYSDGFQCDHQLPKLDLQYAENYLSWCITRSILRDFGLRFQFRLQIYNGMVLTLAFLMALSSVAIMYRTESVQDLSSSPSFIHVVVWVLIFSLAECSIIFIGFLVNLAMRSHRSALSLHLVTLRHRMSKISKAIRSINSSEDSAREKAAELRRQQERVSECVLAGELVVQTLEQRDEVEPLKVLGLRCTSDLCVAILSSLGVLAWAYIQFVFTGNVSL